MPSTTNRYTRYFYHCFPQWISSAELGVQPSYESALQILSLMFKWGLLLTPEEIVFRGEPYRDEEDAQPIKILQRRLCLSELAEDELPNHAQLFGPVALEFDQPTLRRIGGMPVVYIPQPLSTYPEHDHFALIGQTFVYRLFEIYQVIADLAEIHGHIQQLPPGDLSVTLAHPERDSKRDYPTDLLREFFENLTYRKQPLSQLSSALRLLGCFFYPTDSASTHRSTEEESQLAYYREREWRVVSDLYFGGTPLDEELPYDARGEVAASIAGSFSPYEGKRIDGLSFTDACKIVRSFRGEAIMNSVRRILVPEEILFEVEKLAHCHSYKGTVAKYAKAD